MRLDTEISELRKEISQFRTETRQRLEIIENEVNKQVSTTYNRAVIEHVADSTIDLINTIDCSQPEDMVQACKIQMTGIQEGYLGLLKEGRITEALNAMDEALLMMSKVEEGATSSGKQECASCIQREAELIQSNKQLLGQLRLLNQPSQIDRGEDRTISSINPEAIHDEVINPLANKTRLNVMLSIFSGQNRFSNFVEVTGQRGGQLLYHLKILLDNDFITQYASKDYVLTKKGLKTLSLLSHLM
jgi:hypothetical protein